MVTLDRPYASGGNASGGFKITFAGGVVTGTFTAVPCDVAPASVRFEPVEDVFCGP